MIDPPEAGPLPPAPSNKPATHDLASVPARLPWEDVRQSFREEVGRTLAPWLDPNQQYLEDHLAFALGRFDEGLGFLRYFELSNEKPGPASRELLDIGSGTGGVALPFANCPRYRVSSIDVGQNQVLRRVVRATGLPVMYALADGHRIPFASNSFDIVLLIDTLEHIRRPSLLGAEVMRVLRPGGSCLISTPARAKHLLAPDPHYGLRYIAALPNWVQRFIVNSIARRRIMSPDGSSWPAYDVEHLYWHVRGVSSVFPNPKSVDVLFASPPLAGPVLSRRWWRRRLRNFLFDHILVQKKGEPRTLTGR